MAGPFTSEGKSARLLNGEGAPPAFVGRAGDFYFDTTASRFIGPKDGLTGWPTVGWTFVDLAGGGLDPDLLALAALNTTPFGRGLLEATGADAVRTAIGAVTAAQAAAAAPVQSVAGRGGVVALTKADVGLSAADNTSDADKPVSTAQALADAAVLAAADARLDPLEALVAITVTVSTTTTVTTPYPVGTKFNVADGVTLVIDYPFMEPAAQRFFFTGSGTGSVTIHARRAPYVLCEWFGGLSGTDTVAAATATTKAIRMGLNGHGFVQLLAATYFINDEVVLHNGYRGVAGMANSQTAVLQKNGAVDVFRWSPGGLAGGMLPFPIVRDLAIAYTVDLTDPAPGAHKTGPCALRCPKTVRGRAERIIIYNPVIGVYLGDTGAVQMQDVVVVRDAARGSSIYYGFYLDGEADNTLNYASPNASLKLINCTSACIVPTLAVRENFYGKGKLADLWLIDPETAGGNGIRLLGDASDFGMNDVHILRPVVDAFTGVGIEIKDFGREGACSIIGGYTANTPLSGSCIKIDNSDRVAVTAGHQMLNDLTNAAAVGLDVINSHGWTAEILTEDFEIPVKITNVSNYDVKLTAGRNVAPNTGVLASLNNASHGTIDVGLTAGSGALHLYGVDMSASSQNNVVKVNRVAAGSVTTRVRWNGIASTQTGHIGGGNIVVDSGALNHAFGNLPPVIGRLNATSATGTPALALSDNTTGSLYFTPTTGVGVVVGTDALGAWSLAAGGRTATDRRLTIEPALAASETGLTLHNLPGITGPRRVFFGAADSGGPGARLLIIGN